MIPARTTVRPPSPFPVRRPRLLRGRGRAMARYYANHPEMMARLLKVRVLFVQEVRGAPGEDAAREMRECIVDELERRGRGRFRLAASPRRPTRSSKRR